MKDSRLSGLSSVALGFHKQSFAQNHEDTNLIKFDLRWMVPVVMSVTLVLVFFKCEVAVEI